MDVSVVICSYNRSGNLPDCINALNEQQQIDEVRWEIVVVDNNSTDDTKEAVSSIAQAGRIPTRYLFEPQQGTTFARNRGIAETDSAIIAFVDDDIRVTQGWLRSILDAFSREECDVVGGRIHLRGIDEIPGWLGTEMRGFLGFQDFGPAARSLDGKREYPYAGNMAFRRKVLDKVGRFDTKLGKRGHGSEEGALFRGGEADFARRLADAGGRFWYEPKALVYHLVIPSQLNKAYFRRMRYGAGLQHGLLDTGQYRRTFLGVPLFLFRLLARAILRYLGGLVRKGPSGAFELQLPVAYLVGQMRGLARRRGGRANMQYGER